MNQLNKASPALNFHNAKFERRQLPPKFPLNVFKAPIKYFYKWIIYNKSLKPPQSLSAV